MFHGLFQGFFHGLDPVFTGTKSIFFTGYKKVFTGKKEHCGVVGVGFIDIHQQLEKI